MHKQFVLICMSLLLFVVCRDSVQEKMINDFLVKIVEKIKPLEKERNLSYWTAATTGKEQDYAKYSELDLQLKKIYSDPDDFMYLKRVLNSAGIKNPGLKRQVELLYFSFLQNQIQPDLLEKIVNLSAAVEMKFSTFRGKMDNKKVTSNDIDKILKSEVNSSIRKAAWEAGKQVGPVVAQDIIELVKLRNQAANKLGFDNFYSMSMTVNEQSIEELDAIFSELAQLTDAPFIKLKADLDQILAANYHIPVQELMPWHYHDAFFQETPLVYNMDLDKYYQDKDVKSLASQFYAGIGLPVESILEKSDLYERDGKNPHAFCSDMDREGDVRILCNLENNERWMETALHELGHAVYEKYMDFSAPYLLRGPAHSFTTEAVAMFFGRLSRDPVWMRSMLNLPESETAQISSAIQKYAQFKQIIFARWSMVMYHFEKQLYANPDQDLNHLWWQLVEKYQHVRMPQGRNMPDWAAKIHFIIAPCYYHNYLLGELLASQFRHHLALHVLKLANVNAINYVGQKQVGDFFHDKVFMPGARQRWDRMISDAAGEPLTAKYFIEQFIND